MPTHEELESIQGEFNIDSISGVEDPRSKKWAATIGGSAFDGTLAEFSGSGDTFQLAVEDCLDKLIKWCQVRKI